MRTIIARAGKVIVQLTCNSMTSSSSSYTFSTRVRNWPHEGHAGMGGGREGRGGGGGEEVEDRSS